MNKSNKKTIQLALGIIGLLFTASCRDSVFEEPDWNSSTSLDCSAFDCTDIGDNSPRQLYKEIKSGQVQALAAQRTLAVPSSMLEDIRMTFDSDTEWIELVYYGNDEAAFDRFSDTLQEYLDARLDGHTKEYVQNTLARPFNPQDVSDPNVRMILSEYPTVPADRLVQCAQPVSPEPFDVYYVLTDGAITWQYCLFDGGSHCFEEKRDAKEYDPQYKAVIEEANKNVIEQMDREGIQGIGSCHTFWDLKQKYLRKRGIKWKSPGELNPGTMYD